jgi:Kef-type K+ transport system membrane component KefB
MPSAAASLLWISIAAVLAPLLALLVPRRLVPEVVLLLAFGVVIGPNVLDLAAQGEAIGLLRELGLGMLFLLAGYEIEPAELAGRDGRRALLTWFVCFGVALSVGFALELAGLLDHELAVSIALTSTALGTLLPILKDGGLLSGRVGASVLRHGAYGELAPVVAIALLLSTHGLVGSIVALAAFGAVAAAFAMPSLRLQRETSKLLAMIRHGAETTGQTPLRLTILLLVALIAVAELLDLDVVLAAFAAGFILRLALPRGDEQLEVKITGIAFGFLVPIFFVTSGMAIDPEVIVENLSIFALMFVLILLARGCPVFLASRFTGPPESRFGARDSLAIGLFASTGLPIIVAVTSVAVGAGQMTADNASILVGAGAATVLLCPMLATLVLRASATSAPREQVG